MTSVIQKFNANLTMRWDENDCTLYCLHDMQFKCFLIWWRMPVIHLYLFMTASTLPEVDHICWSFFETWKHCIRGDCCSTRSKAEGGFTSGLDSSLVEGRTGSLRTYILKYFKKIECLTQLLWNLRELQNRTGMELFVEGVLKLLF